MKKITKRVRESTSRKVGNMTDVNHRPPCGLFRLARSSLNVIRVSLSLSLSLEPDACLASKMAEISDGDTVFCREQSLVQQISRNEIPFSRGSQKEAAATENGSTGSSANSIGDYRTRTCRCASVHSIHVQRTAKNRNAKRTNIILKKVTNMHHECEKKIHAPCVFEAAF